jgi:hypothetical protein
LRNNRVRSTIEKEELKRRDRMGGNLMFCNKNRVYETMGGTGVDEHGEWRYMRVGIKGN